MHRFIAVALLCVLFVPAAQARHHVRHHAFRTCVESGTIMRPICGMGRRATSSGSPFEGVVSIRVTMHRVDRKTHRRTRQAVERISEGAAGRAIGNGIVRSKSGATAHVAARATAAFQCLLDGLDRQGYPIDFISGWRAQGSVRGSLHPAGLALDVNQIRRNVTRPRMPVNEIALANACHLVSGAQWANGDSGHFQVGGWVGRHRHYAHRHHHRRYAHRHHRKRIQADASQTHSMGPGL